MNKTSIEWTDFTWNPVTGCDKISQGCKFCYAETMAKRFWGDRKFTDVMLHHDRLAEPAKYKKKWAGKKVFVCSMSDLFHKDVPDIFINEVFKIIVDNPDTTFQILTKRIDRAAKYFRLFEVAMSYITMMSDEFYAKYSNGNPKPVFPIPNLWLGVSVEDQTTANQRIPLLLQIPAAVRFLSCEPLLGPVDLICDRCDGYGYHNDGPDEIDNGHYDCMKCNGDGFPLIDWVIVGGESGSKARHLPHIWVDHLREQCEAARVPFFFKQWGTWIPSGQAVDSQFVDAKNKRILYSDGYSYFKLGKAKTGNLLDGWQHLEFPTSTHKHTNTTTQ